VDGIANSSHAKLKRRPPWKPGCEPKADKDKTVIELQLPPVARLTIGLKRRKNNSFYDEKLVKAMKDLREAVKVAFIRDITKVFKVFKHLRNRPGN